MALAARVKELLGPHERAIARVLEDAIESAQGNPAGIDLLGGASPATQIVDGDLPGGQWQSSPSLGRASGGWEELGRGLGDAALRAVLSRALVAAKTEHEALLRARRLASVLLGMERHCFFLVSAQDKALVGAPIERDPPHLEELRIALATSGSLLAIAARERRPVHAFGAALKSSGAAVDRSWRECLRRTVLLCVPMSSANGISGVMVFAIDSAWDEQHIEQDRLLAALSGSVADAVAGATQETGSARTHAQ